MHHFKNACLILAVIVLIIQPGAAPVMHNNVTASAASLTQTSYAYLPIVSKPPQSMPKLLGLYAQGFWHLSTPNDINTKLLAADTWTGKKHSIVGFFYDINYPGYDYNFKGQLEALWQNGYVPLVNLNANITASQLANGAWDSYITQLATSYASWVNQGGGRKAFIAPLPEMNGKWTTYGLDTANFKKAYSKIQTIFANQGAAMNKAWWVFAPNGWSEAGHEFENYYPGNDKVDIVGFSSYNYGFCKAAAPYQKWENYDTLYAPYLTRMRAMAPTKPIIITQTGTTGQYSSTTINRTMKDQWLVNNYNYLAGQANVLAIMYYDYDQSSWECDYTVYNTPTGVAKFEGYKTAAANPSFSYISPANLSGMSLVIP